jgi:circadian clock protein KaiC
MTLVQHGIFGNPVDEAAEVSYLADTVILMRYFEVSGSVRQAISVVKKRSGNHERTIRECKVQKGGLFVGEPLRDFQGVLTGVPQYTGGTAPLLATDSAARRADGIVEQSSEAGDFPEDGMGEHGRQRHREQQSR